MNKSIIMITVISAMAAAQPSLAGDGDHHMSEDMLGNSMHTEHMQKGQMEDLQNHGQVKSAGMGQMKGMFLVKKEIDGFTVTFHAMKAKEGMQQHGGTYHSAGQMNGIATGHPQGEGQDALSHNLMIKGLTPNKIL